MTNKHCKFKYKNYNWPEDGSKINFIHSANVVYWRRGVFCTFFSKHESVDCQNAGGDYSLIKVTGGSDTEGFTKSSTANKIVT